MPPSGRLFPSGDLLEALRRAKKSMPPLEGGEYGGESSCTWEEFAERRGIPLNIIHNCRRRRRINEWSVDIICQRLGIDFPNGYFMDTEREEDRDGDVGGGSDRREPPEIRGGIGPAIGLRRGQGADASGDALAA